METVNEAAEAFVGASVTPEQKKPGYRVEYNAFLAGAAWQREQDKRAVMFTSGIGSVLRQRIFARFSRQNSVNLSGTNL